MAITLKRLDFRVHSQHRTWSIFPLFVLVVFLTDMAWGANLAQWVTIGPRTRSGT